MKATAAVTLSNENGLSRFRPYPAARHQPPAVASALPGRFDGLRT